MMRASAIYAFRGNGVADDEKTETRKPNNPRARDAIPREYRPAKWLFENPPKPADSTVAVNYRDALYAAIGRTLTAWELLDSYLASLHHELVDGRKKALREFGSIRTHANRLKTIRKAGKRTLGDQAFAELTVCLDDIANLAKCRNLIAHGVVVSVDPETGEMITDDPRLEKEGLYQLLPAPYSMIFQNEPEFYRYSIDRIEQIGLEVLKMQSRVGYFLTGDYHRYYRMTMNGGEPPPAADE